VAGHEKGCSSVCIRMFDMLKGRGRTSEAWSNSIAFEHTGAEMG